MEKIKVLAQRINHKALTLSSAVVLTLGSAVITHAADGTADADVTSAFTTLAGNAVATIKGVALLGVGVMTIFLLWKYGKKIFNKVAN